MAKAASAQGGELGVDACCLFHYSPICMIYGRNPQSLPFIDNILPSRSFPLHSEFFDHLGQDFKSISCHCCFVLFLIIENELLFVRLVDILKYAPYISQIITSLSA